MRKYLFEALYLLIISVIGIIIRNKRVGIVKQKSGLYKRLAKLNSKLSLNHIRSHFEFWQKFDNKKI